jgi:hypothetical protein
LMVAADTAPAAVNTASARRGADSSIVMMWVDDEKVGDTKNS